LRLYRFAAGCDIVTMQRFVGTSMLDLMLRFGGQERRAR
jgi:hypothetical protein